jgi:hypothetical protein
VPLAGDVKVAQNAWLVAVHVHPAEVDWRAPDARPVQQILAAPGRRPATFASTTRQLRTAA